MGFLLGLIVGMIICPLILVIISKPLMRWFVKRQANQLMSNVAGRLSGLQDQIQNTNKDGTKQENSEAGEDRGSKGTTSTTS